MTAATGRSCLQRALGLVVCAIWIATAAPLRAQTAVTLSPAVAPSAGQAGVTSVNVTGSNFPAGTILPAAVTVTLDPVTPGAGPSASTAATAVATVTGTTRRVTFQLPATVTVAAPAAYLLRVSGVTSTGVPFASANTVTMTVNPPAAIASLAPSAVSPGATVDVTITTVFTNFVQGSTQASFGPGTSVNGGADAAFAAITVTSAATATARVTASVSAAGGPRTVVVRTGVQQASLAGTFTVNAAAPSSPPVITISLSPQPNANGWHNTPVTAHFTCTQDGMPLAGCPADRIITAEGANQTVTGSVTSAAGQTASVTSDPFSIDLTPPVVTVALSPVPNASGIFTAPVTAHFTCADTGSSVAFCPLDQIFSVAGTNLVASGTGTDLAGNSTPVTSPPFTIQLGGGVPIIEVSLSPAPNANGWHNTPVTAHFTCTQEGMPLAGCPADRIISTEGANQTVSGSVTNAAGQTASVTSGPFSIDATPPVLTLSTPITGTTVFVPSVTLTGILTDALSGIASADCNGAPALVSAGALTCTVSLAAGANAVTAAAVDRAGNPVSASLGFTYSVVPLISILQPANLTYTSISPTTITGTVDDPTARVVVNAVEAAVANGSFSVALPLAEGPNIVTATATSASGAAGTATLWVTLDTTPPRVTVTSPSDQFVTTDAAITVSGIVNDIVVGTVNPEQAAVTVNGVPAQVANRMFLAGNVPLALGPNVIQVVGRDRVGNQGTTQVTVIRVVPTAQPRIQVVSGSGQSGTIRSLLPAPLAIALTDAAGSPAVGRPVIFKVTQNDGLVVSGGAPAPTVIATTDAQGRAQVQWTLGGRAGAGGNIVEAYSVGFEGTAVFTATGNQGPAGKIVVDTGNNQYGPIGQRLPRPLVAVVVDEGNNRLGGVPVTFTVSEGGGSFDGEQTSTVVSDPDGRVAATLTMGMQEGESNNIVSATFDANQGFPAAFTASGRAPGDPARTTITGVVLDNSNIPIPGVTIRAVLTQVLNSNANASNLVTPVATNAQGQFTIPQAPVGFVKLIVDGSTATLPGSYPSLDYDIVTVAGQNMTVGQPIYLLPLESANSLCVTDTTGGGTLTIPEAPGFSLTFGPGQVTFPGGSKTGCVSVTVVHPDKVPMTPGFGQQPRFIVTIQPAGAVFNPPAPITLPNVDGLQPRATTEMYSFDHDIGSFVAIGTGTVSDDGLVIRSNTGVGVLKAGWHCGGDPATSGTAAQCAVCFFCPGSLGPCMPQGNGTPCGNGGTCQFGRGCVGGSACPPGYVLEVSGQCCNGSACTLASCPPGQVPSLATGGCVNSGPCPSGYTLVANQCCFGNTCTTPQCDLGEVFDPASSTCVSDGRCAPGYTLTAGQCCMSGMCNAPCGTGQVFNPGTATCQSCGSGCSACTVTTGGAQQCLQCADGQPAVNGQCGTCASLQNDLIAALNQVQVSLTAFQTAENTFNTDIQNATTASVISWSQSTVYVGCLGVALATLGPAGLSGCGLVGSAATIALVNVVGSKASVVNHLASVEAAWHNAESRLTSAYAKAADLQQAQCAITSGQLSALQAYDTIIEGPGQNSLASIVNLNRQIAADFDPWDEVADLIRLRITSDLDQILKLLGAGEDVASLTADLADAINDVKNLLSNQLKKFQ